MHLLGPMAIEQAFSVSEEEILEKIRTVAPSPE